MMAGFLVLSVGTMAVSTYAWFTSARLNQIIVANGDLSVTNVSFVYYRWNFDEDPVTHTISPSSILAGTGEFVKSTVSYDGTGARSVSSDTSALTMNMYDPYLKQVYAGTSFDLRTKTFIKVSVSVLTACEFDFSLKVTVKDFTLGTGHYDYLSSFITFQQLSGDAIDDSSFTPGSDDAAMYTTFKNAFTAPASGTYSGDTLEFPAPRSVGNSLSLVNAPAVMGGEVVGEKTTTLTYWICFDYDQSRLDDKYISIDLGSAYTLSQDFDFSIQGTQSGI